MNILIDTNVILDVLCNRTEFIKSSAAIWKLCETNKVKGYISALSIPNIVYILRKELSPERTAEIIDKLLLIFSVADLRSDDLRNAAKLLFADYEDAIQSVCASRIKASYIVTRNIRDFKDSIVPAVKPDELLDRI